VNGKVKLPKKRVCPTGPFFNKLKKCHNSEEFSARMHNSLLSRKKAHVKQRKSAHLGYCVSNEMTMKIKYLHTRIRGETTEPKIFDTREATFSRK